VILHSGEKPDLSDDVNKSGLSPLPLAVHRKDKVVNFGLFTTLPMLDNIVPTHPRQSHLVDVISQDAQNVFRGYA
jgi:hypothetical protein